MRQREEDLAKLRAERLARVYGPGRLAEDSDGDNARDDDLAQQTEYPGDKDTVLAVELTQSEARMGSTSEEESDTPTPKPMAFVHDAASEDAEGVVTLSDLPLQLRLSPSLATKLADEQAAMSNPALAHLEATIPALLGGDVVAPVSVASGGASDTPADAQGAAVVAASSGDSQSAVKSEAAPGVSDQVVPVAHVNMETAAVVTGTKAE